MKETTVWAILIMSAFGMFSILILSNMHMSNVEKETISKMVEAGANPVEAGCTVNPYSEFCKIFAAKKQ